MDVNAPEGPPNVTARPVDAVTSRIRPDGPELAGRSAVKARDEARPTTQERLAMKLARMIEEAGKRADRRVDISLDEETHEPVIRVYERDSGKLVREIPPEVVRRIGDRLARIQGLLIDRSA